MINEKDLKKICLMGHGKKCCRYIGLSSNGFECLKKDKAMKKILDKRVVENDMEAQGDNCSGI